MSPCYLASPYTGRTAECASAREGIRFAETLYVASILLSRGRLIYSPVILGHTINQFMRDHSLPRPGWEFWMIWSKELLLMCDSVFVLCADGWRESRGVAQEIRWAQENEIPITYINGEGNIIEGEME